MHTWSDEQDDIFYWFEFGAIRGPQLSALDYRNLVVRARAGTGKTTTILEGVTRAPERAILIAAFSKIIQEEISTKLTKKGAPQGIKAQTLHSVGLQLIRKFRDGIKVDFSGARADAITEKVCGASAPDAIKRLVTNLHTKGREIAPHAKQVGDLTEIQIKFDCIPDEQWENSGFPAERVEEMALAAMEFAALVKSGDTIDGSDMIFLPVRNGWLMGLFDMVVVDEAQDMTTAQLEIAQGVCRKGGRICVVGDDRQAIFGFRGADSESLDRLKQELNAGELGLKTTYRCGKRIVEMAAGIVPDFTAAPANPEGEIRSIAQGELLGACDYGDFILSRANAPLLPTAIALLRAGRRARIAGLDIGRGLKALIGKLARGAAANSVPAFIGRLGAWRDRELARAAEIKSEGARSSKIEFINDRHDMLLELSDGAVSVGAITAAIEALFTDDGLGAVGCVTLSSVHRAKGLEANRVFILADTLRTGSVEEDNIRYVAITRAKRELVMVYSEEN
jgi:superfamily I DNA/RNA helicase